MATRTDSAGRPAKDESEGATRVRSRGEIESAASFVLTVTDGPDKGRTFTIDGATSGRVLVGQGPACDVRLTDPECSRRHAALEPAGGELRLTDLESTNGTFVDRVRVVEVFLQGGEFLRIGSTVFQVEPVEPGARAALPVETSFGRLIGSSAEMRRLYPLFRRMADSAVPVIIEGETGTGKEVLAESLHDEGPRASGPFVVFDCTAVAPNLIESDLFGHEKGAFTGAQGSRPGVFEQAQGGTLFIDEIGDLDPALQPKLLRALDRSEVRRVGGDRWIKVDVRVVAATRNDLDRAVQAGRFRDDLFHRLAAARVELPPLRRRGGDIEVLARRFWANLGGAPESFPVEALARWKDYGWPGNVRELKIEVSRQLTFGDLAGELGTVRAAPRPSGDFLDEMATSGLPFPRARDQVLDEFEQRYIAHLLAHHGGDVERAVAASGIGRRYFQKLRTRSPRVASEADPAKPGKP